MLSFKLHDQKFTGGLVYSFTQQGMAFSISFLQCRALAPDSGALSGPISDFLITHRTMHIFQWLQAAGCKTSPQKTIDP